MKRTYFVAAAAVAAVMGLAGSMIACGNDDDVSSPPALIDGGRDTSASPSLDADTKADSAVPPSDAGNDARDASTEMEAGVAISAPAFAPPTGSYDAPQCVMLSAPEGEIHYTLDGSAPTAASPIYGGPIGIFDATKPTSIAAIAITDAGSSAVAKAVYTITNDDKAPPVAFDPPAGAYDGGVVLKLASNRPDAVICYQLDAGTPVCIRNSGTVVGACSPVAPTCAAGLTYDGGAIALGGDAGTNVIVKAVACAANAVPSDPTQASYSF